MRLVRVSQTFDECRGVGGTAGRTDEGAGGGGGAVWPRSLSGQWTAMQIDTSSSFRPDTRTTLSGGWRSLWVAVRVHRASADAGAP